MKNLGIKITSSILLLSMLAYTMPVFGYTKEETVYSKIDASGKNYKTTVSSHIKNTDGMEIINDVSNLMNIENVSGNNEMTKNTNTLTWKANGNDIYYQGNTNKELPIDINIKYYLNDVEVFAKDIAGKTGKVKVIYEFKNKESKRVVINGKYETLYVPFIVGIGSIIDNDVNKNIEITSGKVIDNGNKSMVFGLAFPGMQESLGIEKNTLKIPSTIEVTMDSKEFKMGEIYVFATPKLIEENDFELLNKLDKICNMAGELKDASSKLVEGTDALDEGAKKLNEGTNEALSGAKLILSNVKASTGSLVQSSNEETLKEEQIEAIKASASEQAVAGIKAEIKTIDTLAENGIDAQKEKIAGASIQSAKQIAEETAIATAKQTAGEVAVATAKQTAKETAGSVIDTIGIDVINAGIKQTITEQVIQAVAQNQGLTVEQVKSNVNSGGALKEVVDTQVQTQYNAKKITKEAIVAGVEAKFTDKYNKGIKDNVVGKINEDEIKEKADEGIELKKEVISSSAVSSAKQVATATAEKTAVSVAEKVGGSVGENVASEVANKVKSAALKEVATSMSKLTDGLNQLANGLEELDNGAGKLANGTNELSEGMNKFDKEGIQKIYDLVNGNVKGIKNRVQKLQELADEYNTFSGINENANGSVKFIIMIDKVEKEEKKEKAILPNEVKEEKE